MSGRGRRLWLLLAGVLGMGCATNPHVRVRRLDDGRLQVDGPLAGPFERMEDLAAHACGLMTRQGGASAGMLGSEYCALHYYSPDEGHYFLSYLSDVKQKADTSGRKTCIIPSALNDPARLNAIVTGGDHTHPHNRRFSTGDLSGSWYPSRVVDPKTGRVIHRELFLFYRERNGACSAYSYDYVTRIVSALRGGRWVQIGRANNNTGDIQMFEGKDWLP